MKRQVAAAVLACALAGGAAQGVAQQPDALKAEDSAKQRPQVQILSLRTCQQWPLTPSGNGDNWIYYAEIYEHPTDPCGEEPLAGWLELPFDAPWFLPCESEDCEVVDLLRTDFPGIAQTFGANRGTRYVIPHGPGKQARRILTLDVDFEHGGRTIQTVCQVYQVQKGAARDIVTIGFERGPRDPQGVPHARATSAQSISSNNKVFRIEYGGRSFVVFLD